jgi:hypothetical protein
MRRTKLMQAVRCLKYWWGNPISYYILEITMYTKIEKEVLISCNLKYNNFLWILQYNLYVHNIKDLRFILITSIWSKNITSNISALSTPFLTDFYKVEFFDGTVNRHLFGHKWKIISIRALDKILYVPVKIFVKY